MTQPQTIASDYRDDSKVTAEHCGHMNVHEPHAWSSPSFPGVPGVTYRCSGDYRRGPHAW